jgi:hypothetical protein
MRISKIAFWFAAFLSLVLLTALVASFWQVGESRIPATDWKWSLKKAGLIVQTGLPNARVRVEPVGPSGLFLWPGSGMSWKVAQVSIGATSASLYVVALWLPLVLAGAGTGIAWRLYRRPAVGCLGCGYDIRGIKDRCPECGKTLLRLLARLLGLGGRPIAPRHA